MPKARHRKNHKKKVASRNQRVKDRQNAIKNYQRKFIEDMIKKEQEKGLYEEAKLQNADDIVMDGPDTLDPDSFPDLEEEGPELA